MTSLESYSMTPADDLNRHLMDIDAQCQNALDRYNALCAQRGIVLEALGVSAIQATVESPEIHESSQIAVA